MYVIHSMHGPTVYMYDTFGEALERLLGLMRSNGGTYRIMSGEREFIRINTYFTTEVLNAEENARMYARQAS